MYINISGNIIDVKKAKKLKDRFMGLMFKKNINYGLLFEKCNSIHTNFMKEPIDIIALDNNNYILDIKRNLKPWKYYFSNYKRKETKILELPNDSSISLNKKDHLMFK